ncbi:MAG: hypothetical protein OXH50_02625 [Gemmatimonadetes bacterium]|nr:hypothetical protein [Gemmatimonadota bacterium]
MNPPGKSAAGRAAALSSRVPARLRQLLRYPAFPLSFAAWGCAAPEGDFPVPNPPEADRETWGASLQLRGQAGGASVRASYLEDFSERQTAAVRDGVEIAFFDSIGLQPISRLTARRLTIDYRTSRLAVAGDVILRAAESEGGDSLSLRADTLEWVQAAGELQVPGDASLTAASGRTLGRGLVARSDLSRWSLSDVEGRWVHRRPSGEEFEVAMSAARESGSRGKEGVVSEYESPRVRFEGRRLQAGNGAWWENGGRLSLSEEVVVRDSFRTLRAGAVDIELDSRNIIAREAVVVEQDSTRLTAAELVDFDAGRRWEAAGQPLKLLDGGRSLSASHLVHRREGDSFIATGKPHFSTGDDTLYADSLDFQRAGGHLTAAASVRLSTGFGATVTAAGADLDLSRELILLNGRPRFSQSSGSLEVAAERLSIDLGSRSLSGQGEFRIDTDGVRLNSRRGTYDAGTDTAVLGGQVRIEVHGQRNPAKMAADSVRVAIGDIGVDAVEVPAPLTGSITADGETGSWLQAGSGSLELENGRLTRVRLAGEAEVTHVDAGSGGASRFGSDSMVLDFDSTAVLRQVSARGNALVRTRLGDRDEKGPAGGNGGNGAGAAGEGNGLVNEVSGEQLEIFLDDTGGVTEVRISGGVDGRYAPSEEEE